MSIDIKRLRLGDVIVAGDHPFLVYRVTREARYLANMCSASKTDEACLHARVPVWTLRVGQEGVVGSLYTLIPADS